MSTRTDDLDRADDLRAEIDRTGYYPEVVADCVASAVAGEKEIGRASCRERV